MIRAMNPRDEAQREEAARRRRRDEMAETKQWVHHVADLATGQVLTTVLDRPVAPISRAERLSRLGQVVDTSIFGGPWYRLTARRPYQESPLAYLIAGSANGYDTWDNEISWQLPANLAATDSTNAMRFYFDISPEERSVLSVSCTAVAHPGRTGHVRITAGSSPESVNFPIGDHFAHHTIDLGFIPLGGRPSDIFMTVQSGVSFFTFQSVSFGTQSLVLNPGMASSEA
jgi:hypothetical protein